MAAFKFMTFLNIVFVISSQDIFFEGGVTELDKCNTSSGFIGNCRYTEDCPQLPKKKIGQKICGFSSSLRPLICCPTTESSTGVLIPKIKFECGKRGFVKFHSSPRGVLFRGINKPSVVGGEESGNVFGNPSLRHTWPWMALLGEGKINSSKFVRPNFFCDGVLINERFILTAAHCLLETEKIFVRLSEHNYNIFAVDGLVAEDIEVESIFEHPKYNFNLGYNDLALIKMAKDVSFTESIRPICLPWDQISNLDLLNTEAMVTGWGAEYFGGPQSPFLQEVNVTIFDPSECKKKYSELPDYKTLFPQGMTIDSVLCAGDVLGGKDACQGDSGAPLVQHESEDGSYVLAGIVSKGYGCGSKDFPGLYAPIRNKEVLQWIKDVAFQP